MDNNPPERRDRWKRLHVAERLQMEEDIGEDVVGDPDSLPVPQWHKDELRRRWALCQADPDGGRSWEEFEAELLQEL